MITLCSFVFNDGLTDSIEWCSTKYCQGNTYLLEISKTVFSKSIKSSIFVIKLVPLTLMFTVSLIYFVLIVMNIISDSSEYFLSLPYHVPFCEPHNFLTFLINWLQHYLASVQEDALFALTLNYFYVFILHLLQQCDTITILISNMKSVSEESSFENWLKIVIDSTEDVKR